MAIPISRSMLLISLLLVLSLISPSFARPNTNANSDDLVTNVCKKHENPGFCIDALKSDPRSNTDDAKVLAQISLELATFNATGTRVKIHSLLLASRDPVLTDDLNKCADFYDIGLNYLESAPETLKSGDYVALQRSSNAFSKITTELLNVEAKIAEEDLDILLLSSLSSVYETLRTTLLIGKDMLTVDEVTTTLLETDSLKNSGSGSNANGLVARVDPKSESRHTKKWQTGKKMSRTKLNQHHVHEMVLYDTIAR
ncbi:hypothetical protein RJ640_025836 [Escallonia rubra]|uniref:Pectinesterase inhibitor domain-containing protein n=1 Tax=Escallonia rubra TaxID=112253 RepID=A0AA88U3E2_9ASTE|nr:hypothetical protein RJ640_025836 [Escallonia rubra]